jgi:hypothetical protein
MATPNKGRLAIRRGLKSIFLKETQAPAPSAPPEDSALRPCPQCGAWQWRVGLVRGQCTACGYEGGPGGDAA